MELLKGIGVNSVLAGDTRYDRVIQIIQENEEIAAMRIWQRSATVIVAGSTWPPDEKILLDTLHKFPQELQLIIAPHEVSESHIQAICKQFEVFKPIRLSQLENIQAPEYKVLIVDSIGLLARIYAFADICYVGGGFGSGIHNTLEPAAHGKPVIFGLKYHKFQEAIDLIACQGGFSVRDSEQALNLITMLLDPSIRIKHAQSAQKLVNANKGATSQIVNALFVHDN